MKPKLIIQLIQLTEDRATSDGRVLSSLSIVNDNLSADSVSLSVSNCGEKIQTKIIQFYKRKSKYFYCLSK